MSRTSNLRTTKALIACLALAYAPFVVLADGPLPEQEQAPVRNASTSAAAPERFAPPLENEVVVSDRDFNHFVFPAPIVNGPIFPAGSPVLGKPVYLSNNQQFLLQVEPGADKPFNMIVELQNGAVYKFWLRPRPVPGVTHRVGGASETRASAGRIDTPITASARAADVELMKRLVSGQLPEEFEPQPLPPPARFDKFSVIPLASWSDGVSRRVTTYSLVAAPGQTAVVAAPEFYRPGITAITVDGDVVDVANSPTLYVIEEAGNE